jgi:preprotein translocase subunit SecF
MSRFSDFGNSLYSGDRSFNIVGRRKIWYSIAAVFIALSVIIPIAKGGFNIGIEFRGGVEYRVPGETDANSQIAKDAVASVLPSENPVITTIGGNTLRIQTTKLSDADSKTIYDALLKGYNKTDKEVTKSFIGASWGADVTNKAINGLVWFLALAAILMAGYFRTLKMSAAAMLALVHDLVITAGIYGITGFEVTPAAVIGFLTILGYSLYDTVVVFDKIRENTFEVEFSQTATFAERVNLAVNQTLVRSINTSVVAVLPVAAILFIGSFVLGAGTLRDIALALFVGIIVGTYSSIFIAPPAYAQMREGEAKFKKAAEKVLAAR